MAESAFPSFEQAEARAVSGTMFANAAQYRCKMELQRHDSITLVDVTEICCIHYGLGAVRVYCSNNQNGFVDISLTKLIHEPDTGIFFRASRQHIVNVYSVGKIRPTFGRNKLVCLKPPYENVSIEVTNETAKAVGEAVRGGG